MLPECMAPQTLNRHSCVMHLHPDRFHRVASRTCIDVPVPPAMPHGALRRGQGEDDCAGGDRALGRGLHERARRADHDGQVPRLVLGAEAGAHHSGMRTVAVTPCPADGLARR
jgi:hypothetical protein